MTTPATDVERIARDETCPICGHKWRQHDPEDGKCDAGPPCGCGRDLVFMQERIAVLSQRAFTGGAGETQGAGLVPAPKIT